MAINFYNRSSLVLLPGVIRRRKPNPIIEQKSENIFVATIARLL
jgi:hypothetical protein